MPTRPEIRVDRCPQCDDDVPRTVQVDTETGQEISREQGSCRWGHVS
jgi:hypothetical protein